MSEFTPFAQYIHQLCEERNLSLRQASIQAGMAPESISQILRREAIGGKPRPETLEVIAVALGGDYYRMMKLIGYLPQSYRNNGIDPLIRAKAEELIAVWRKLREIDPPSAQRLMEIATMQAEMVLAAARSKASHELHPQPERQEEEEPTDC